MSDEAAVHAQTAMQGHGFIARMLRTAPGESLQGVAR